MHSNDQGPRIPKQQRTFDRRARAMGWRAIRRTGSGHYAYRHPDTPTSVFVSATPSCCRAHRNGLADMRRLLRAQCQS